MQIYENLVAQIPEVLVKDLFDSNINEFNYELDLTRSRLDDKLKSLEDERVKNEALLRPNLGHPSMLERLESINEDEIKRQKADALHLETYALELRKKVLLCSEKFLKELSKCNESLLIKFDDLLCLDDIKMHGKTSVCFTSCISNPKIYIDFVLFSNFKETSPEKLKTSELLRQKMKPETISTSSNETAEKKNEESTGKEVGRWRGVESSYAPGVAKKSVESTINTLKATMAHKECSAAVHLYNQVSAFTRSY